ncbi:MAG: hypothetical protein ACE15B_15530 [Bryobacteraceae bacterium]
MNHREREADPGANWAEHAGEYRLAAQDGGPLISILARNGGLYLQVKLHYSQPTVRLRRARFHGMEEVEGSNPSRSTKVFQTLTANHNTRTTPVVPVWCPKRIGHVGHEPTRIAPTRTARQ